LAGDAGVVEDGGGAAVTADGKVRINVASEQDLRRLPGIGATRARAILALRERLGRFRRAEDLLRVKGIGRRMLGRLRPLVIIDP
jgi:competence protein ComEA